MTHILITGANSYIGTSFEKFLSENHPNNYTVDTIDLVNDTWQTLNFSDYDCVFHVAGIAHQKETKKNAHLYHKVNCELTTEIAKKAKSEGVSQFIFMSSMSVYGKDTGIITRETIPTPKSNYGRSKLHAEQNIIPMTDEKFHVCVLRPPMVYGKGCKGNFVKIKKLVEKLPIFPKVKNQKSMIYIDNLSSFVKLCVDNKLSGIFFPQNSEYISTTNLATEIGNALGKRIHLDYITGGIVYVLRLFHPLCKKAFGNLTYNIAETESYCIVSNKDSIRFSI